MPAFWFLSLVSPISRPQSAAHVPRHQVCGYTSPIQAGSNTAAGRRRTLERPAMDEGLLLLHTGTCILLKRVISNSIPLPTTSSLTVAPALLAPLEQPTPRFDKSAPTDSPSVAHRRPRDAERRHGRQDRLPEVDPEHRRPSLFRRRVSYEPAWVVSSLSSPISPSP